MFLCLAVEVFEDLCESACSTSAAACLTFFVREPFEKGGTHYSPTRTHAEQSPTSPSSTLSLLPGPFMPISASGLPMPITVGQFTFSTHYSWVVLHVDACRHRRKKQSICSLFFILSGKCVCVDKQIQQH